jgi:hypothetical protein
VVARDTLASVAIFFSGGEGDENANEPVLEMEFRDDQESLIIALPKDERSIFLDRLMSRRSWEDIARRHRIPAATARKRFQRAMERLQKWNLALCAEYEEREEPDELPPAMRTTTVEGMGRYVAEMESRGIHLTSTEKEELMALACRRASGSEAY